MATGPNWAVREKQWVSPGEGSEPHGSRPSSHPMGPWVPKDLRPNRYSHPPHNHRCHKPVCHFSRHIVYSVGERAQGQQPPGVGEGRREQERMGEG